MTDAFRFRHVVSRNFLVWRKLLVASLLGNLVDPLVLLFGLGFGLGRLLPDVGGVPYFDFLASGFICYGVMYSASFESLWSAFSRLKNQRTWEGILQAPMSVRDVVLGEWVWAALKGTLSGAAILLVMTVLGLVHHWTALWVLPLAFLVGLAFAGIGLVMTSLAQGFDFFTFYFTLVITPMVLLSGVYFPSELLPGFVQTIAQAFPLAHATPVARALVLGQPLVNVVAHVAALILFAIVGVAVACLLTARRLSK